MESSLCSFQFHFIVNQLQCNFNILSEQFAVIHRGRSIGLAEKQNRIEANRSEKKVQSILNPKIDEVANKNK